MAPEAASPASPRFAEILAARRGRFNAQFAEARRYRPSLEAADFSAHLTGVLGPIVEAVAERHSQKVMTVTDALYDLSLDLVSREFLGPRSRYPAVVEGWSELLRRLPGHLAAAPRRLAAAITNALYQLEATPEARPREWMQAVAALAEITDDVEALLQAAQVAAWRAGLAHYRLSALERCRELTPALAVLALGISHSPPLSSKKISKVIDALLADPWLDPAKALEGGQARRLQLVRRAGAFRGFGGLFMAPPFVTCPDGQLVVSDGGNHWLLYADRFGAVFQRTEPVKAGRTKQTKSQFKVELDGRVGYDEERASFPVVARSQSSAANATTLAVTTPLSHSVYLFALAGT
jgi:hypothetical protein